jgi:hypothetical protein
MIKNKKGRHTYLATFYFYGSPARTRTTDMVVNSHPLYRLSYWGRDDLFNTVDVFCQPEK